jgi:serine/threonine protein kinase
VYLVDGYAVKTASYRCLSIELCSLILETTVLSMLGRLKFIGMNDTYYYIGMEYYPNAIMYETPKETMDQLLSELRYIHSFGIIHCDIKGDNIRTDSNGHARLIDFGCSRFSPAVNKNTHIGTSAYRDYRLLKRYKCNYGYEIDIWSLGIVFYILETKKHPWYFGKTRIDKYYKIIELQWDDAMKNVSQLVKSMLSLDKYTRYIICDVIN